MSSFDEIIGYESAKNELYQIIDMFKNKDLYEKMGAKLPKGVLIYGEPGMGKSMLASAFIKECNVKSYVIRKNKDEKDSVNEITNTFEEAAKDDFAIILIDDIDKFSEIDDFDVDDMAFVSIQAGIDSVKDKNILVIATANNYKKLPSSLRRNGRFDRRIELKVPTSNDARKIIEHYMKNRCVSDDLNYEDVSKMISYTSCADLETILNESAIYAAYQRKDKIDIDDIVKAFIRDNYSAPEENLNCSESELAKTAIHEAGHVVIAEALHKGSVGFVCLQVYHEDSACGSTHLCEDMKRRPESVLVSLAGKAAVELFYEGRCGSGCQSDLKKAAFEIREGINHSGTSGLNLLDIPGDSSEAYYTQNEAVVKAELERFMFLAKDGLIKNKEFLMKLAEELKTKRSLLYSDIQRIRASVKVTEIVLP